MPGVRFDTVEKSPLPDDFLKIRDRDVTRRSMNPIHSVLVLALFVVNSSVSAAGSSFEMGSTDAVRSFASNPVVVLSPALVAAAHGEVPGLITGDATRVSIDLVIGLETLLRLGVDIVESAEIRGSLQLELVGGGTVGVAGISPVAGGGARVRLELLKSATGRNALLIGPGINFLVAWDDSPEDPGMVDLGPDSEVLILAPSIDIAWVHQFSGRFGLVLGLHAGAQVAIAGIDNVSRPIAGRTAPVLSFYTGIRF
jgi:hypothetical protein